MIGGSLGKGSLLSGRHSAGAKRQEISKAPAGEKPTLVTPFGAPTIAQSPPRSPTPEVSPLQGLTHNRASSQLSPGPARSCIYRASRPGGGASARAGSPRQPSGAGLGARREPARAEARGRAVGGGAGQPERRGRPGGEGGPNGQPIRQTVPPQGMALRPMGRALHSVNAVGRGSEKRAGWEPGQAGVCPREGKEGEVAAKNCGNARPEFILPRLRLLKEG